MKRINVAVIGCGYIAEHYYIPNLLSIPEAKLVALCDINEERLKIIRSKINLPHISFYKDYNKILERDYIDAVVICNPTRTHVKIVLDAIKMDKHVFIEKPMAISLNEAKGIVSIAKKERESYGWMSNAFLIHIEAHSETLIMKPEDGILLDYTCHFIDLLRWYLDGNNISSVLAMLYFDKKYNKEIGASLLLRFDNGVLGIINTFWLYNYTTWAAVNRYVGIVGTKGKIIIEQSDPTLTIYKEGTLLSRLVGLHRIMPRYAIHPKLPLSQIAYRKELEHFIDSILRDKEPKPNAEDAASVLYIIELSKKVFLQ